MKSICFFCSYYTGNTMPAYVKFYLRELSRHFSEVVLVTNEKEMIPGDVAFLNDMTISINLVVNEGYDFGMYSKMLKKYDVSGYDRVGLVNDSCILFKKLDPFFEWVDKEKPDVCALTDSYEHSYHLQSYLLIINKNAILFVIDYFAGHGIINDFLELIRVYEVELSAYLINANMSVRAYYPFKKDKLGNPSWINIKKLIKEGFPLIKKKIITRDYIYANWKEMVVMRFYPYPMHYIKFIKKVTGDSFPGAIFSEFITTDSVWRNLQFGIKYIIFRSYKSAIRLIKELLIIIIGEKRTDLLKSKIKKKPV